VRKDQGRVLTAAQFYKLAEVSPELEWFANLRNSNTHKAYENDLREFHRFVGVALPQEFRAVTRAHVIAWRKDLERRACTPTTIQRKLAALSSLFANLTEQNAVLHNPVDGVRRPKSNRQEGTTPALSDEQAWALLTAPQGDSLKAKRDRAILATLAYHGMRREELCKLKVRDLQRRDGVLQFRIEGKGEKVHYVPVGMKALRLITEYLEAAGHKADLEGALFRPLQNRVTGELNKPLHPV
jgi:integrase/recombinase XerD